MFLSYASTDRDLVEPFFDALVGFGFEPWMDSRKLRVGQNWDFEIQRALDQAKIVLVFLSGNSVDKRGYVQKEIKIALRKLDEKLIDDVYIIPVALENVERPVELSQIQFVAASDENCMEQIREAVSDQLEKLDAFEEAGKIENGISYKRRKYSESYDGIPGYEINVDHLFFDAGQNSAMANVSEFVSGQIAGSVMDARHCKAFPDPDAFNIAQAAWSRTNTLDWVLQEVSACGRGLSIVYTIHYYGAGAVHPVSGYRAFNFFLSPLMVIRSIRELFEADEIPALLQVRAREELAKSLKEIDAEPDMDWINSGTSTWDDFENFSFQRDCINFHFGSYAVAAYAFGHQIISVPLSELSPLLTEFAALSLDAKYLTHR